MFEVNQVVQGKVCGVFRIVKLREVSPGVTVADLKELHVRDHTREMRGLVHLTTDCLLPLNV